LNPIEPSIPPPLLLKTPSAFSSAKLTKKRSASSGKEALLVGRVASAAICVFETASAVSQLLSCE
jgi:hypothetical protein